MNEWLPAIVVASLGGLVTLAVALVNRRTSPYEALAKRVVGLEASDVDKTQKIELLQAEVAKLRADVTQGHAVRTRLRAHIAYLIAWIAAHAPDVQPQPQAIDPDLLEGEG